MNGAETQASETMIQVQRVSHTFNKGKPKALLSLRIVKIGMLLGLIASVWKGREFKSEDGLNFILWPFTVVWLAAFLYVFIHMLQTGTRRRFRLYFAYPVLGLIAALFVWALAAKFIFR